LPLIIEHMKKTGEWGEFFPISLSPFAYNETTAQDYFPLTPEKAKQIGAKWKEPEKISTISASISLVPDTCSEITDSILDQIYTCKTCNKNYKFINQELEFYKNWNLPAPQYCPDCRHNSRASQRNPRKIYNRDCAKCQVPIQTTYSPERPETVYCEACYLKEVY